MKNVGFHGGSSICELGPRADVALFFECLDAYVEKPHSEKNWSLLTDRLYRRYLKQDELDEASALMRSAKDIFGSVSSASVDWNGISAAPRVSRLNPDQGNLADVFSKYFEKFDYCVESAKVFFKSWNIYQPVRTVVSDMPDFMTDKKRPLDQYEVLEGKPFWLR